MIKIKETVSTQVGEVRGIFGVSHGILSFQTSLMLPCAIRSSMSVPVSPELKTAQHFLSCSEG